MAASERKERHPATGTPEDPVLAAGAILWRPGDRGPEFLLLRNARHGTWGFAKGHLDRGETLEEAALREIREETGLQLGAESLCHDFADTGMYRDPHGNWKRVIHFLARAPDDGNGFSRSPEHDEAGWFSEEQALARLEHQELRRALIRAATRVRDREL